MAEDMTLQINIEGKNDTGPSIDSLQEALTSISEKAQEMSQMFQDFSKTITSAFSDASISVEELARPLSELGSDVAGVDDLARAVAEVGSNAVKSTEEVDKMVEAAGKAGSAGSKGKEEGLFSMSGQMDTMYAGMTLGVMAAPLDAGLGASVKAMADYDSAMRQVNQEMKLSQGGFSNLEQAVLSLSNSTGISSQDLASGLYNVVATGVTKTSDALTLLKSAAEGAKAGNTDLNTTTAALNAVMGAYGMKASNANHIMDVMFTAVNNGQMHFDALAKSVGASATSAATAGVGYEELAAAQATLTNVGKNAQSASQNLNSLIMGMIAPTAGATKEAKSLGIEWDAQTLKAHGLTYMIDEATKATGGNAEELKKLVPNQRAYMAVLALGSNAHKQYTDTLNKMKDANGATAAALKQTEQGAGDSIEKMKTELMNAGISIAMGFAPAIGKLSDGIQKMMEGFSKLSPSAKSFIGDALLGAAAVLTLGSSFFMTISAMGALISGVKGVGTALGIIPEAAEAAAAATTAAEAPMAAGFLAALGPIALIVAAVAAVGIAFKLAYDHIKPFHDAVNQVGQEISKAIASIKAFGTAILDIFKGNNQGAANILTKLGFSPTTIQQLTKIVNQIKSAFNAIKNVIMSAMNAIANTTKQALGIIFSGWTTNNKQLQQTITQVWNAINNFIKEAVSFLVSTIGAAIDTIFTWWQQYWPEIQKVTEVVWEAIKIAILPLLTTIMMAISAAIGFIKGAWQNGWQAILAILKSTWDLISGVIKVAWDIISGLVSFWLDLLTGHFQKAGSDLVNIFKNVFNDIKSTFSNLVQDAFNFGSNFVQMIAKGITGAVGNVVNAVKGVAGKIKSFLGFHSPTEEGPASDSDKWGPNFVNMMSQSIQDYTPKIQAAVSGIALTMKTGMTTPITNNVSNTMALPGGANGGNVYNITVQASGNITRNEQDLTNIISKGLLQKMKTQGKF